jgi:hypothetical protein
MEILVLDMVLAQRCAVPSWPAADSLDRHPPGLMTLSRLRLWDRSTAIFGSPGTISDEEVNDGICQ